MISIVAKTKRLVLVNLIDLFDADYPTNYRSWLTDPDVTRYNSHGLFPYTPEAMKRYVKSLKESRDIVVWAMLVPTGKEEKWHGEAYGRHIGNVTLQKINWIYRSAEMAIVIGEKDCWGAGYATEALTALYDHGFNRMNLHRIFTGTASTNKGMQCVAQKLGMKQEGVFREAVFLSGTYVDVLEYGILSHEWKNR
jgi:RimJ/RimL family protein N-acetyltransferase